MTLRSLQVPSVLGGITQQPKSLARPDRVKRAQNVFPFPDRGLAKRAGSSWLAQLEDDWRIDLALRSLDLGTGDRYTASFSNESVRVFGPFGTEYAVRAAASATPDFTYLDLRHPNRLTGAEDFTTGWSLNALAGATLANAAAPGTGPQTPLGWNPRPSGVTANYPSKYTVLEIDASGSPAAFGDYSEVISGGFVGGVVKFSMYVNTATSGTLCTSIILGLIDNWPGITNQYRVLFTWSSPTSLPTITPSTSISLFGKSMFGYAEQLGPNDFRIMLVVDTAKAGTSIGTADALAFVLMGGPNAGTVEQINAWGAHLVDNQTDVTSFPPYAEDPHILRTLPVVDTTFVANPQITAAAGTTLSSSKATVLGNWAHFPGDGGASRALGDVAFIWVRQAVAGELYKFEIKVRQISGGTVTRLVGEITSAGNSVVEYGLDLATQINVVIAAAAGTLNHHLHATVVGADSTGAVAEDRGSVIVIRARDTYAIDSIHAEGGVSSPNALIGFKDEIATVSDLPLFGIDGVVVKLVGVDELADSSIDAYSRAVLRFREKNKLVVSTEFLGSAGFWEEGTDYGVVTDFNDATLPHILVRRQDSSTGTVTGVPFQIYFTWEQYGWDDRLVGSDERNPAPSFIGKRIFGLGLFENRLVLTAGQNAVMSEGGVFDNFWRTTLRTLPASERIDVAVSGTEENTLRHVGIAQSSLFLFGEESVLLAEYGDLLSSQSIGFSEVSGLGATAYAAPAPTGALLLYAVPDSRGYARVEALLHTRDVTESLPLSSEVSRLVPNNVLAMQTHKGTGLTFLLSSDRTDLRVIRTAVSGGDVLQNAWTTLTFGASDRIAGIAVLHDTLHVAVRRGTRTYLEAIPLASIVIDEGEAWHAHLDMRVDESRCTAVFSSPNTTVTLPYTVSDATKLRIVRRDPLLTDGTGYTVVNRTTTTVVVSGDITAHSFFVGLALDAEIEPLTPAVFESGNTFQGRAPRPSAVEVIRRLTLELTETGAAALDLTYGGSTMGMSHAQNDPLSPSRAEMQTVIGGSPDEVSVVLSDDSHFPFALTALEWEADVALKS